MQRRPSGADSGAAPRAVFIQPSRVKGAIRLFCCYHGTNIVGINGDHTDVLCLPCVLIAKCVLLTECSRCQYVAQFEI